MTETIQALMGLIAAGFAWGQFMAWRDEVNGVKYGTFMDEEKFEREARKDGLID
jgi:hypothetical protein